MSSIKKSFDLALTQNDITALTETDFGVCEGVIVTSPLSNTEEIRISNKGDVASNSGQPILPGHSALIKKIDPRNIGLFTTGAAHTVSVTLGPEIEIISSSTSSGGGGGDASAANQTLALAALDSIYDVLALVGTEATSADIFTAVTALGNGATLSDLAAALAPLATEATQADILAKLEAQGLDVASIKASVDLLVPDLDAVRVATESLNNKFSQLATGFITVRVTTDGTTFGGLDTELPTAVALTSDGVANPTAPAVAAHLYVHDGAGANTWNRLKGNTNGIWVTGSVINASSIGTQRPVIVGGADSSNIARTIQLKNANPLAADYGVKTREIPLQKDVVRTTAGTPAASLVVRPGPCWLFDVFLSNNGTSEGYITVYDLTAAPTHGAPATARKVIGRHVDPKVAGDPFNYKENFGGLYFSTGCVLVVENASDDANTNTSGAQVVSMEATFVAGT